MENVRGFQALQPQTATYPVSRWINNTGKYQFTGKLLSTRPGDLGR